MKWRKDSEGDGCLDEAMELMFAGGEGKEERSFGSIYRRL